jgi:hypothetical protein
VKPVLHHATVSCELAGHRACADAAARFLQAKAVERKLPGPAVVAKRNDLLKLVAQPRVLEGADLSFLSL